MSVPYSELITCPICKGSAQMTTCEGNRIPCACVCVGDAGPGKRRVYLPHPSHKMTKERCEIRCPGSEPRFYGVRDCENCGEEELTHPAGHFLGRLGYPCSETVVEGKCHKYHL